MMVRMIVCGVFVVVSGAGAACHSRMEGAPVAQVRLATGGSDGAAYSFGAALARASSDNPNGVRIVPISSAGSTSNVDALEDGAMDIALARADVVYAAFVDGTPSSPRPHQRLRGVASLWGSALHIVVRADSPIRTLAELSGLPVGVAVPTADVTPVVVYGDLVAAGGLSRTAFRSVRLVFDELIDALRTKTVAAAFFLGGYPIQRLSEYSTEVPIRLLEIAPDAAMRIRAAYPFYKPMTVPAGVYVGQVEPATTVAVETLLVAREDLPENLVYDLAKTLFESLPRVTHDDKTAQQIEPDLASATPIPLHPGAARYYRERELLK